MRRTRAPAASARVQEVGTRIEKWRKARKKRSPMPEPLWDAAVQLAQTDGVHPVARMLRLNYQTLKCRVAIASSREIPETRTQAAQGFVELSSLLQVAPPPSPSGPVLELLDTDGGKLTIRLPAERALDVERLAEAFLRRGP